MQMKNLLIAGFFITGFFASDPKKGKQYKCYVTMERTNRLELRGFMGISMLGRTQVWKRVQ